VWLAPDRTHASSRITARFVALPSVCNFHYQQLLPKLTDSVCARTCMCVCVCVCTDAENMSHFVGVSQKTTANIPRNGVVRFP